MKQNILSRHQTELRHQIQNCLGEFRSQEMREKIALLTESLQQCSAEGKQPFFKQRLSQFVKSAEPLRKKAPQMYYKLIEMVNLVRAQQDCFQVFLPLLTAFVTAYQDSI